MRFSTSLEGISASIRGHIEALALALVVSTIPVSAFAQEGGGGGVGFSDYDDSFNLDEMAAFDVEQALRYDRRSEGGSEQRQFLQGTSLLGHILSGITLRGGLVPSDDD